jgi:cell division protein FtsN
MYIILIAWIYVVFMMAIMEKNAVAGIMTFLLYGLLPAGILFYLMRNGHRRRQRHALEQQHRQDAQTPENKPEIQLKTQLEDQLDTQPDTQPKSRQEYR